MGGEAASRETGWPRVADALTEPGGSRRLREQPPLRGVLTTYFALRGPLRTVAWAGLAVGKLATLAYAAEAVLRPDEPKYKGKAMRIRSLGYLGGLALVPGAWWLLERDEPYPVAADLAVTVPLLIDAAGNSLGIYDEARLDDLVHGFNTAVLASLFGAVISTRMSSRAQAAAVTVAFGVVGEIAFDGMEYVAEALGFQGLGLSREDTLADIAAASIGAVVAGIVTWARWQPRPHAPLLGLPELPGD